MQYSEIPFGIEYVRQVLGIRIVKAHAHSVDTVCPTCGHKCLNINVQKNVYNCPACGECGNMFDLAALYWGCDRKEAYRRLMRDYEGIEPAQKAKIRQKAESDRSRVTDPPAAPDERDAAYRALLDGIGLSGAHWEALIKRGLSEEDIERNMYRSYPQEGLGRLAKNLSEKGISLSHIPGFYEEKGKTFLAAYRPGIMVPVTDEEGRISAFQVRMDEVSENGGKYIWLSSGSRPGGQGVTGCRNIGVTVYSGDGSPVKSAFLTEGPLKMDVVRSLCAQRGVKTPFYGIALTGVANQGQLAEVLGILKSRGLERVYEVIDMDLLEKKQVKRAADNIDRKIAEAGLTGIQWTWKGLYRKDSSLKGYDDLLLYMRDRRRQKENAADTAI